MPPQHAIAGSTAVVALVRAGRLLVGSVGDSRCVLGRAGHALELSECGTCARLPHAV